MSVSQLSKRKGGRGESKGGKEREGKGEEKREQARWKHITEFGSREAVSTLERCESTPLASI